MAFFDPYQVLGISPSASDDEVKKAYRTLSRKYHPDANINNPNKDQAEERFKMVQAAYDQIMKQRQQGYAYGPGQGAQGNGPYGSDPNRNYGNPFGYGGYQNGSDQDPNGWYRDMQKNYGRPYSSTGSWCLSMLLFNLFCNCCC